MELIFSSKSIRRDSIRKLSLTIDRQKELNMVGRVGDFKKKLVKVDNKWETEYEYIPSYVYLLFLVKLKLSEEKIEQRKLKNKANE